MAINALLWRFSVNANLYQSVIAAVRNALGWKDRVNDPDGHVIGWGNYFVIKQSTDPTY